MPIARGVYVEEGPDGVRPITGAGTSTPAFLGLTLRDPAAEPGAGAPYRVSSWSEFSNCAADADTGLVKEPGEVVQPGGEAALDELSVAAGGRTPAAPTTLERGVPLKEAVYGFFANGGSSCYIVPLRVDDGGFASLMTALDAGLVELEKVPDVHMVAAPDAAVWAETDQELAESAQKLAAHCAKMRNRMAILDTRHDPADNTLPTAHNLVTAPQQREFAALYYPWVMVPGLDGKRRTVPSCGHIAGVWASTDAARGVFKAPANVQLQNVVSLPALLTDDQQAPLNDQGVNCLRVFPDHGPLVWGARSLAVDNPDWKYLNVRRLVCFLSDSIKQSTTWAVFEPNDEHLWSTLRQSITAFLKNQWRQGALQGTTPDEAFQVVCDESTNPQEAIDGGEVNIDLYIAPVRPAEFIHFTIAQEAGRDGKASDT